MGLSKERIALIEFLIIFFFIIAVIIILITMELNPDLWILLLILAPIAIIPLGIIVHELSHILVMKFYTQIQISKLTREQKLTKQPFGKVLLAGYAGDSIFGTILIILGLISLFKAESFYYALGIILLILGSVEISNIIRSRYDPKGDFYNYRIIKNKLLKGCSCGSNEFKVHDKFICAKCGKILYKFKTIEGGITTAHLNPYYLFSKKTREISYKFATDAPLEEIFNLISSPTPKKYWKEFDIEGIAIESESQWTTLNREFGQIITRILEKEYPSKLVMHITYEIGFGVTETIGMMQRQDQVEVRVNAVSSEELMEFPIRRAAKRYYKKLIQEHLSKELNKKFKFNFY